MQSAQIVPLKLLREEKYARVLCYPRYNSIEAEKRIRELNGLGVKALEFAGEKQAFNLQVLGKGYVGIVLIAHMKQDRVALKIRRVDADRKNMEHEAEMLIKANRVGVGPHFIGTSEDFLLMEYIDGALLPKWVANLKGKGFRERIRQVLRDVLEQCRKLDEAALDHGELSRASKHVIIDMNDKVHIVDFETASIMRRASNVTSICQYIFVASQLAKTLRRKFGKVEKTALISALRDYKLEKTEKAFFKILQTCGLEKGNRHTF